MQIIHKVVGTEGERVVGCTACGEVAHLQPGENHKCGFPSATAVILTPANRASSPVHAAYA